jgi:hypothetical protein
MPGSAPFRLNRSGVLLALISAGFAGEAAAAAGKVDFATAGVTVAGRDGQARPLARGAELDSGDTVRTTSEGRAQIRFSDGSYVSLQPNTDFAISDYKFEGKDDDRGFFGLVKGAMRTVTGAVGRVNRNSYRITTPTATVGIRGTGGVIQVLNDGSTLVIGTSGIWSLTNPAGSIDIPAGVSGLAPTEPNTPPKETTTQPQTSTAPVQPKQEGYVQGNQVNPDGTAAITMPATVIPLVSGPGYAPATGFALSSGQGNEPAYLDGGEGAMFGAPSFASSAQTGDAVFNAQGQLTQLTMGGTTYKLGTGGSHAEFNTDGILAWGRWIGPVGITGSLCEGSCDQNYSANQGFHYVIGMPTPVMPTTGTATYSVLGATSPTYINGQTAPGTFSGSLAVTFGAPATVSGSFQVAMPANNPMEISARTYNWSSTASTFNPYFYMNTSGVSGCQNSGSGCSAQVTGFFAGASAERAGASYRINDVNSDGYGNRVIGAAAFKKN